MTIQRQYSLPNCTLIVEGMSDEALSGNIPEDRPLLSILVNVECYFTSTGQRITGGREFFDSLMKTASAYAQEFLSGIYHPQEDNGQGSIVHFERIEQKHLHRLVKQPESDQNGDVPVELELTTVQLFDLVEALDQCVADHRTLPNLSLPLEPVSKRYRKAEVPVAKRVAPAAIGVSGLALATAALFFLPIPEVREPEPVSEEVSPQETTNEPETLPPPPEPQSSSPVDLSTALASAQEIIDPTEVWFLQRHLYRNLNEGWANRSQNNTIEYRVSVARNGSVVKYEPVQENNAEAFPSLAELASSVTPTLNAIGTNNQNLSSLPASVDSIANFRVVLTRNGVLQVSPWNGFKGTPTWGKEITNSTQLRQLNQKVYQTIRESWKGRPSYRRDLVYRVAVNENGEIADYEPHNQPAADYVKETPLPDLWEPEAAGITDENETVIPQQPLGHFKVVFKPSGVLQVSPWRGFR